MLQNNQLTQFTRSCQVGS